MTIAGDFAKDGFAVFPGALNSDLLDKLRSGIDALVDDFEPSGVATIFSTDDQSHGRDQYFLESGDKIRFFFEDGAMAPDGSLTADKSRSLNKIGHAMHDLDPAFSEVCRSGPFLSLIHISEPTRPY